MNLDATHTLRPPAALISRRFTFFERIFALANRHRATGDMLRVLERWIDDREKWVDHRKVEGSFRWIRRRHPEYRLAFTQSVRGQILPVYVDYHAKTDFLGLYVYWPEAFETDARDRLHKVVNTINWKLPFGNFELEPVSGNLRYRMTIDVEGICLTPAFLHFMLESGLRAMDHHATDFLPGPTKLVA